MELKWFELKFTKETYHVGKTILYNIPQIPLVAGENVPKLISMLRAFKPQAIVSDFDINGLYLGELFRVPVILISNMHLMEYYPLSLEFKDKVRYYLTEKPVLNAYRGARHYIISSIVKPPVKQKHASFFYPLVRKEFFDVQGIPAHDSEFVLVYMDPKPLQEMQPLLALFPNTKFKVYGGSPYMNASNVEYCSFDQTRFAEDVKNCAGIISHGGISLLSEAMICKKPLCTFTTKHFFERYYNGMLVKMLGYGEVCDEINLSNVSHFLENLPAYQEKLKHSPIEPENDKAVKKIEQLLETHAQ